MSSTESRDPKNQSSEGKQSENLDANYSSNPIKSILRRSWVRARPPADLVTPAYSFRYLLTDADDYEPVLALPSADDSKAQVVLQDETNTASKSSAPSDQVVVLKVSLHCKGCVGKVRKHLSRMDELAAKKVKIVGDVTPLNVLASVSKIKNAQFWPASTSEVGSSIAETKTTSLMCLILPVSLYYNFSHGV